MPVSVLFFLAALSAGTTIGTVADKVVVGQKGEVEVIETSPANSPFVLDHPTDDTPFEVDHGLDGVADTPFELDTAGGAKSLDSASAVQEDRTINDTPFVLDAKGAAPPPKPSIEDLPYNFGLKKQATPTAVARAPPVNDSPFVVATQAQGAATPSASHAAPVADSPFVVETQGTATSAAAPRTAPLENSPFVVDTKMQASPAAAVTDTAKGKGAITIVKNGDAHPGPQAPRPATTRMVLRIPSEMATTTGGPASKSAFSFELGDSMVDVSGGQDTHVAIPSTPFEIERALLRRKYDEPGKPIELLRPGFMPAARAAGTRPASLMEMEVPAVREAAAVLPHVHKGEPASAAASPRLLRYEEVSPTTAPSASGKMVASELQPVQAATDTLDDSMKAGVQAAVPLHAAFTAPQTASDPTVPLAGQTNDSLSLPASVFNATSAESPLNLTNITMHLPKVVTVRGAVISIFVGGVVTVFFFTIIMCILNAGKEKDKAGAEVQDPPRQTRTYRQLLASQMATQEQQPEVAQTASGVSQPAA